MRNSIQWRWVRKCVLGTGCFALLLAGSALIAAESSDNQTTAAQNPGGSNPTTGASTVPGLLGSPKDSPSSRDQVRLALLREDFAYDPEPLIDPFLPFIAPQEDVTAPKVAKPMEEEESEAPPEPPRPLTPLQRMTLAEVEAGLKAIMWGEMGRRAVIQDATGKGYIVTVGTPVVGSNGIITEIFKDRVVIQQEVWDRKAKKMVIKSSSVRLSKEKSGVN